MQGEVGQEPEEPFLLGRDRQAVVGLAEGKPGSEPGIVVRSRTRSPSRLPEDLS